MWFYYRPVNAHLQSLCHLSYLSCPIHVTLESVSCLDPFAFVFFAKKRVRGEYREEERKRERQGEGERG